MKTILKKERGEKTGNVHTYIKRIQKLVYI